jgi:RNA polymerase sigma factor (sigma-70 family)
MNAPRAEGSTAPVLTIKQHQLVRDALPMVEECADSLCRRYDLFGRPPPHTHIHSGRSHDCVGYSDMCSIGKLALYDAVPRFQEGRNRSFRRFARLRVFGAMMNELKCATRQARIERAMLRAVTYFLADYNDDFDISQHDQIEMQRRVDNMCDVAAAVMFVAGTEELCGELERDAVADAEENARAIEALRKIVGELSEDNRKFLDLLFGCGFDHHAVGEQLGLARETVCRRLSRLCANLKRLLKITGIMQAPPRMQLGIEPVLNEPAPPEPAEQGADDVGPDPAGQRPRRRR